MGTTALGLMGGAWLAAGGVMFAIFLTFVKFAVLGDVVP